MREHLWREDARAPRCVPVRGGPRCPTRVVGVTALGTETAWGPPRRARVRSQPAAAFHPGGCRSAVRAARPQAGGPRLPGCPPQGGQPPLGPRASPESVSGPRGARGSGQGMGGPHRPARWSQAQGESGAALPRGCRPPRTWPPCTWHRCPFWRQGRELAASFHRSGKTHVHFLLPLAHTLAFTHSAPDPSGPTTALRLTGRRAGLLCHQPSSPREPIS